MFFLSFTRSIDYAVRKPSNNKRFENIVAKLRIWVSENGKEMPFVSLVSRARHLNSLTFFLILFWRYGVG